MIIYSYSLCVWSEHTIRTLINQPSLTQFSHTENVGGVGGGEFGQTATFQNVVRLMSSSWCNARVGMSHQKDFLRAQPRYGHKIKCGVEKNPQRHIPWVIHSWSLVVFTMQPEFEVVQLALKNHNHHFTTVNYFMYILCISGTTLHYTNGSIHHLH